jgi:Uma2 family endonuclease
MSTANRPRALIAIEYAEAAQAYLRSLPLEHFMEAIAQATQRKITLESFDLVHARRSDVQVFNELLVQYPLGRPPKPQQIVPDNMVIRWPEPIVADGSYDVPLQPTGPFWVFEYVSKHNKRKDYEKSFQKYERYLKVPYYLIFYPDNDELTLFQHSGRKYRTVPANEHGRYPVPELEMEVGLLNGWVRFWYQGELLPLPADLQHDLDEARRELRKERQRANREKQRAEQEKQRAEQEKQRADEAARRSDDLRQQLEKEHQARLALERELEVLRGGGKRPTNHSSDRS